MYRNEILTNKRCTHAQSNYTYTKLKAWFMPSSQEMEWVYSTAPGPHGGLLNGNTAAPTSCVLSITLLLLSIVFSHTIIFSAFFILEYI